MRLMRYILLSVVSFLFLSVARAEINIGVILSLTGPAASLGIPAKKAVDMWPEKIGDHVVKLKIIDDESDTTKASTAARKLIEESQVDVIVGPSVTPTSLAAIEVAGSHNTPIISIAGSDALVHPLSGPKLWAYKLPPTESIPTQMICDLMKAKSLTTLAIVYDNNPYGQTFASAMKEQAENNSIQVVAMESFLASDSSFTAQALKIIKQQPDAIFIAAAGTPAALPQITLRDRGYKNLIFQTQAVANDDFIRLIGSKGEDTHFPVSPVLVAPQLPDSNPVKSVALSFYTDYQQKYNNSAPSLFAAMAWDAFLMIDSAATEIIASYQPGTDDFRQALRSQIESLVNINLTEGVYTYSETDHNGANATSQVMVKLTDGSWQYVSGN